MISGALMLGALAVLGGVGVVPSSWAWWGAGGVFAVHLCCGYVLQQRYMALLDRHEHLFCRKCRYPLDGIEPLDGAVRCPECGERWGLEFLRDYWRTGGRSSEWTDSA
jgi:hypothetical protein